jgi:2-oxo-3-hexenedioate decarboxylase
MIEDDGLAAVADETIAAIDARRQIEPFSRRAGGFTPEQGNRVRPLLRKAFEARGEKIVGRKIGFTNRRIWPEYGVNSPNWGYVTNRTLHDLATTPSLPATNFLEPKIEPEIMFGLGAATSPQMDDAALLDCIKWVALGYEVVQSIYPNWKFAAADTAASNAMHGALLIGERHPIAPRKQEWLRELSDFKVELLRNGQVIDRGEAANVLDGPLKVLAYLTDELSRDRYNPPLVAGEILSTGTLTRALDIKSGETWMTRVTGIPLQPVTVRFT